MPNQQLDDFLLLMFAQANMAGHIWPRWAACEAALESAWGKSRLYREAFNVFGEKQHLAHVFDDYVINTFESVDMNHDGVISPGEGEIIKATFVKFPTFADCFASRMATLRRLAPKFPHYNAALRAETGEEYVVEVSKSWATDPDRAAKCISIFNAHFGAEHGKALER